MDAGFYVFGSSSVRKSQSSWSFIRSLCRLLRPSHLVADQRFDPRYNIDAFRRWNRGDHLHSACSVVSTAFCRSSHIPYSLSAFALLCRFALVGSNQPPSTNAKIVREYRVAGQSVCVYSGCWLHNRCNAKRPFKQCKATERRLLPWIESTCV